jgi:hypothetical protein
LTSALPFDVVVAKLAGAIGHPDMPTFAGAVRPAHTLEDLERVANAATGTGGLMEMAHWDMGEVLRKGAEGTPKALRLVIGNPLIMRSMAKRLPDAASYAPVTVLIDERHSGVSLNTERIPSAQIEKTR